MAETMKQYMSKTRVDHGSGITRPKIDDKDSFELKGQFLMKLRDNTFNGSDNEDANEHIKKVPEIVDLFHIRNITQDQVMLRAFPIKYCPPSRTAKKMEENNNLQQEPDETFYQAWEQFKELLMKTRSTETSNGLAAIQAQLNNLGREIKKVNEKVYVAQLGCEQCKRPHDTKDCPLKEEGASIKTLEIQIGQISKVLQEKGFGSLPSSTEAIPRDHVKSISTTVRADSNPICAYSHGASHIDNSIPRKEKDPGSFTLPCYINNVCFDNALADLGDSLSVMPLSTYLNLSLGEFAHTKLTVELADRTVKYPKGIAKDVLVVENMDGYRDQDMGDIILGEPFCKASCVEARRFDGLTTIHNGSDNVTYQMA
ncbi:hypothetical protein Tco_1212538 [Tanacetum coccineum]